MCSLEVLMSAVHGVIVMSNWFQILLAYLFKNVTNHEILHLSKLYIVSHALTQTIRIQINQIQYWSYMLWNYMHVTGDKGAALVTRVTC